MLEKLCGWQAPGEGVDQIVQNIVDWMRTLLAENNKNEGWLILLLLNC